MAKKELAWNEITSPTGDGSLFALKGKKYRIIETLKEDPSYGECKQLCRVSEINCDTRDKFAVIVSYIRIDRDSFDAKRAILSKPVKDKESAMDMFESARG